MLDSLNDALDYLGMEKGHERGMYAPLVRRFPFRVDDACPAAVRKNLEENHTCACTDSEFVYVDTSKAQDMFERAKEVASEGKSNRVTYYDAKYNFATVVVHEYTHILMQHVDKGIKFIKANGDKNYPIFAFACDIEANRGYLIDKDSDIYKIAVSEDAYPECKGVVGLMNIYRTLKKYHGDDILKNYDNMKKNMEGVGKEEKEEEKESSSSSSAKEQALADAVKSMEQMKKEIEKKASQMTEEEMEKGMGQFNEERDAEESEGEDGSTVQPVSSSSAIDGYGTTPGSTINADPRDVLKAEYNRVLDAKIAKSIERIKSVVKGSSARGRTATYSRQSRKSSDDGLIKKGVKNGKSFAPRILVAMDSSGSMSDTQVTPIASAIGTIAKTLGKTRGSYICEHDAHVSNVLPLREWTTVVNGYCPGGDNNFDEVLEKAVELNVEVVLDIGDGYARLYDEELMKRAKQKGIKWIDVQVCGQERSLKDIIARDKDLHGKRFIGREIIKCNMD